MIKFFLLLCSLEAEEVATHGAPEAWKEARERVDKTFQVFFHTFVSPAQYILYLIQFNCTKVNDDVNGEYADNDDDDDDNDDADRVDGDDGNMTQYDDTTEKPVQESFGEHNDGLR